MRERCRGMNYISVIKIGFTYIYLLLERYQIYTTIISEIKEYKGILTLFDIR